MRFGRLPQSLLPAACLCLLCAAPARAGALLPDSPFSGAAAGTTAASFLNIPAGARAQSLGEAYSAIADGAEAVFWNPAGLANIPRGRADASVSYDALLSGAYDGSAAFARGLGGRSEGVPLPGEGAKASGKGVRSPGVVGAGIVYHTPGAIQGYNSLGDPTSSFSPADLALSAAYAVETPGVAGVDRVRLGAAVKWIYSSISNASGMTFAADLGAQMKHVTDIGDKSPVDAAVCLRNFGPPLRMGSASDPLPLKLQGGFLWHITPRVQGALEGHAPAGDAPYVSVGLEGVVALGWMKASLRGGYDMGASRNSSGSLAGLSAGLGLDMQQFRLDYAWAPFGDLGTVNRVSLGFVF